MDDDPYGHSAGPDVSAFMTMDGLGWSHGDYTTIIDAACPDVDGRSRLDSMADGRALAD